MKLYTDSFYQKISYDIDTICEKNSKLTFLTPEQFKKQSSIVEEFIREKCLKNLWRCSYKHSSPRG